LGYTDYDFIKSNSDKITCNKNSESKNPLTNFDALWNTFNENYPSFELKKVDWKKIRDKYRQRLNSQSTDLELFNILEEMTSELKDGHVSIEIPEILENDIEETEDGSDELREQAISSINSKYLKSFKTYNNGTINWGVINEDISYIQINDFEDLADYPIDQNLSNEKFWDEYWEKAENSNNYPKDVLNGFKKLMQRIFSDIKQTTTCIIDVRFNGGGFDQAGLEVLSYFTDKKIIGFSKKARFKDGFTKTQNIYIEPKQEKYSGNLYILTSYQTASASETFVLASQNLPKTKTIGSNTEGILSDVLSKKLPNGWEYGLSNEIYESTNGINYESGGIPADYDLDYDKNPIEFYNNLMVEKEDKAIEKVIELSE
jgi:C-terminal processing protease CtpA/Prc